MEITPFQIAVGDDQITDLHRRIEATRWPDQQEDVDWLHGTELEYLRELVAYWRTGFAWRAFEDRINRFPQFKARFDNLSTHLIHARSPHEAAMPLLLVHGWPGSLVEFLEVIPRLTEPEKYGGRAEDACHVVCPALPGYGYSEAAHRRGMGPKAIAARHLALMSGLGYEKFVAQGGDWGAITSRFLPELAGERLLGLHLNLFNPAPPKELDNAMELCTVGERAALVRFKAGQPDNFGYAAIQGSRPQSLGYALADSPVGLCAWITEKFRGWSDNGGELRNAISWDDLLANVSLYWFSNSITSSIRLYREHMDATVRGETPLSPVRQPCGAALYPAEFIRPPKAWVEHEYNVVHWFEAERGGHFAALEQPEIFSRDLRHFIAKVLAIQPISEIAMV